jgi:hypothetical protein
MDRATLTQAFQEALLEIRGCDATTTKDEPRAGHEDGSSARIRMPSDIADILGWHAEQGSKAIERFEREGQQIAIEQRSDNEDHVQFGP